MWAPLPDSLQSQLQLTATNRMYDWSKTPGVSYGGALVEAAKMSHPLQLINPLAPARYGRAEDNVVRNPRTGRSEGIKLFSLSF